MLIKVYFKGISTRNVTFEHKAFLCAFLWPKYYQIQGGLGRILGGGRESRRKADWK